MPSLAMDIADSPGENDVATAQKGLNVFLDRYANALLSEATIDFSSERGFIITGMQRATCC